MIAGVAAAVISHPADTLLSKVNKAGAGGTGTITQRLVTIAKQTGVVGLCLTGLGPRCVMIGTLTSLQFGIFDTVMGALGAIKGWMGLASRKSGVPPKESFFESSTDGTRVVSVCKPSFIKCFH